MIKIKNIVALAAAGALLLTGCGKSGKDSQTEPSETQSTPTETVNGAVGAGMAAAGEEKTSEAAALNAESPADETVEVQKDDETKTADLADCKRRMASELSLIDVSDIEKSSLPDMYDIAENNVKQSACFVAASDGAFPKEVVMVEAVSTDAAAEIAGKLRARLSAIQEQASSYDPDSESLAKASPVVQSGVYVAMFFASEHDSMKSIFESYIS